MAYPTLSYLITDPIVGTPPISSTLAAGGSGTPAVASGIQALNFIGKIVRAWDPTYGEGEFIYLTGLANTAAGDVVIYDEKANTTTRGVAGSRGPVAVAMSANVANQLGWYQISGSAIVNAPAVLANALAYWTATPGQIDDAVVAGDKIDGMVYKTASGTPAAGFAVAQLDRPSANGNG